MSNKKNMSARFASASTRREARRRAEARTRSDVDALMPKDALEAGGPALRGMRGVTAQRPTSVMETIGSSGEPLTQRAPLAPRTSRPPVARAAGGSPRAGSGRGLAPLRPSTGGVATIVDYGYLRADLRRIVLLSLSLLVLLIVLNLLLNH